MFITAKCIGIDMGKRDIRAALLIRRGIKWYIKELVEIKNPLGKTIIRCDEERKELINSFRELNKHLRCSKIVIGIPSQHVVFRNIFFPKLSSKELREAIYWESREFSSIFNTEYICDFQVVDIKPDKLSVLLAAVEKNLVMEYIKIAESAGFFLDVIDVYPLAKARVLRKIKSSGAIAIVEISFYSSEMTIFEDGQLVLTRCVHFMGDNIESLVSEYENIYNKEPVYQAKIIDIVTYELRSFTDEISRFFELYYTQGKSNAISGIVLTGSVGKFWPIKKIFKSLFETNVVTENELHHDFINIYGGQDIDYMQFSNSIGFAMRGL